MRASAGAGIPTRSSASAALAVRTTAGATVFWLCRLR